jgi:hypothetical protein
VPAGLVAAAALLFPLLAGLRHLDDNSLTSWAWVLEGRDAVGVWVLHLAVVAAAVGLARLRLPDRWQAPALVLAAFVAGLSAAGEPEAVLDAGRYFLQAKHLELHGARSFLREWGGGIAAWTDLPLVPFLYGALFRTLGEHRAVAQVFTAALFALTVLATARIGSLLWDGPTGIAGGLFLLAVPCLLVQVPLLMTDVPTMCAVALALWAALAVLERGGASRVAVAALAVGAALLTKYSTWVLLTGTLAAVCLVAAAQGRWRAAGRVAAAAVAGGGTLVALVLLKPAVVALQLRILTGYQWEGLRRWGESYASTFLFQAHPLLAVLALLGLWRAGKARDPRVLLVACVPAILLLLQVRRTRYLLPALPMIALLAARGLAALGGERARRFALLAAVGYSLVTVFALYLPFLRWTNTANLRAAGEYLDARGVAAVAVAALPTPGLPINPEAAIPILDYHTRARIVRGATGVPRPSAEEMRTSSFRFTWEGALPSWYDPVPGEAPPAAQLLVTGDPAAPLPPALAAVVGGREPDAVFDRDAVFRYRTFVKIWLP